ncbi:MAG: glycosyltransferase family 9 protein [Candidatus Vogelbacteria bacterium]|nr:glycosyltransferase family 9 protein [Candidatus Vogelbacteria bacterium]
MKRINIAHKRKNSKLNRILLIIHCLLRAIFFGPAKYKPQEVRRIIVVPSGKLGDVVCTTPVLHAIRTSLPKTTIIVAGQSGLHRSLLADSGLVDEYLDLDNEDAIENIKKSKVDAAIITGPSFMPAAQVYIAGVPLIIAARVEGGISPSETKPYKILQRFIKTFPYRMGEYAPRERLKSLEPLGIFFNDTKKHLAFSETAHNKVKQFFIDHEVDINKDFVVGISPSAGNKIKEWPEDRFAKIADHLFEKYGAKIFITGGKGDVEKANEVIRCLDKKTFIIDTSGKFSLDELKAFMAKLKLFISVDSGPIYIAEAFNVPTIDIVGPMDEHEQPPIGPRHRVVVSIEREAPEMHILNAGGCDPDEVVRQVKAISVDMVKLQIGDLISKELLLNCSSEYL